MERKGNIEERGHVERKGPQDCVPISGDGSWEMELWRWEWGDGNGEMDVGLTVSYFFLVSRNTKLYETVHCFAEFRLFCEIRNKVFRVVLRN